MSIRGHAFIACPYPPRGSSARRRSCRTWLAERHRSRLSVSWAGRREELQRRFLQGFKLCSEVPVKFPDGFLLTDPYFYVLNAFQKLLKAFKRALKGFLNHPVRLQTASQAQNERAQWELEDMQWRCFRRHISASPRYKSI